MISGPVGAVMVGNTSSGGYLTVQTPATLGQGTYTITGSDTAANPREFTMTISYYDRSQPGTPPVTLVDIVITEPASYDGPIDIPGLPNNSELVPYSETVARKFKEVAPGTVWSATDPYQFYLDPARSPRIGVCWTEVRGIAIYFDTITKAAIMTAIDNAATPSPPLAAPRSLDGPTSLWRFLRTLRDSSIATCSPRPA